MFLAGEALPCPGTVGNVNPLRREIRGLFSRMMKLLAALARARSRRWAAFACLSAAPLLCLGCESAGATDAARPTSKVKVHPEFPVPKTPEMAADPEPSVRRVDDVPKPKPREKKDWQANCMIQRACETGAIPTCDPQVPQRPWVDVVTQGEALVGKEVFVSGTLGLSLRKKTGSGTCTPGVCCHTLDMQIVLVGEPAGSLPLRGLTCAGDDSALCCSVPAEGQAVVARGHLQKGPASGSKWQLSEPSLCLIDNTPRH